MLNCPESITHTSVVSSCCRVQQKILRVFKPDIKEWNFPKFFTMRKYPQCIRKYGTVGLTDSGPKESYNRVLKDRWQFISKRLNIVSQELCNKILEQEVLEAAMARTKPQTASEVAGKGVVSDCCMEHHVHLLSIR